MRLINLITLDGELSVSGNIVCQVERLGVVMVIDVHLIDVGEVCWLINDDIWGMRI